MFDYWREQYMLGGVPRDFWANDVAIVGKFIGSRQLKAMGRQELLAHTRVLDAPVVAAPVVAAAVATEAQPAVVPRIGYAGGMRAPHLHYEGQIYSLDRAQWREFAEHTLDTLRHRLAEVKTVGFEQLMELSDVINSVV